MQAGDEAAVIQSGPILCKRMLVHDCHCVTCTNALRNGMLAMEGGTGFNYNVSACFEAASVTTEIFSA